MNRNRRLLDRDGSYRIRWAIPVPQPAIEDVYLEIVGGRIRALGPFRGERTTATYDRHVLLPSLCNAHSHLELTTGGDLVPESDTEFTTWLDAMIARRIAQRTNTDVSVEQREAALARGLDESRNSGVQWVADIASPDIGLSPLESSPLEGIRFVESIGFTPQRAASAIDNVRRLASSPPHLPKGWSPGLSPHAPYTVHPDLFRHILHAASQRGWPVAMHLAESAAESRLLQDGSGPLVDVLRKYEAWQPGILSGSTDYMDYLVPLAHVRRALVIHGTYLDPPHWDFLAAHRHSMAVVYCPRTHGVFRHRPYPLEGMLAAGVRVLLGTDSRATNPDLDLWNEIVFAKRTHPQVSSEKLLAMATADVWAWRGNLEPQGLQVGARVPLVLWELPDELNPWSFVWFEHAGEETRTYEERPQS